MSRFCDVAVPVPLDTTFTYALNGAQAVVGGRVLVPFRNLRMAGIVTSLHDRKPEVETKDVLSVIDPAPVLSPALMKLAEWIAQYYIAPIGEVLRAMLPLSAEMRFTRVFHITARGHQALYESAEHGSSRRSRKSAEHQDREYAVLNYLSTRNGAREETLRASTKASRAVLEGLLRKKWIAREDVAAHRDARRTTSFAVLKHAEGKLNANQRVLIDTLAASGGSASVPMLRGLDLPATTLQTLVRRGLVELIDQPEEFTISSLQPQAPEGIELNPTQRAALEVIERAVSQKKFSVCLLHGVTGSGKTAVYLRAMQQVLAAGRGAILLVPEIGLTPAAAANLHHIFGEQVAILHSALTDDERAEQWRRIHRGDARIAVGTRSAVFAPVQDLALLVVDEEQDSSYKQEETPRYHGRDVAVMRGKLESAVVLLVSATPALESYHNARSGRYALLELPDRVEQRPLPDIEVVDMREEFRQTGSDGVLSRALIHDLKSCFARGEQAMVLLNRRGYAPVVLCRACGESVQCRNCAVSLTQHKRERRLECHYCGHRQPVPKLCPKCGSEYVFFIGTGTERLQELLQQDFPLARIARLDRDTVRSHRDFERVLAAFHAGEHDLLVGTQMIAKGHDIHGVTLVGVVGADFALGFPDFRAAERTFQLLTQVAGRAGRGAAPGKVIFQSYFPEHYSIQFAATHDFPAFFAKESKYRRWMHYPPFASLANVLVRSEELASAMRWAGEIGRWFEQHKDDSVRVLGPAAAPLVRLKRDYRYHFVLKCASRERMNGLLRAMLDHVTAQKIPRTQVVVDVDALSLL